MYNQLTKNKQMTQRYVALDTKPWATITGRLTSSLLHVLPARASKHKLGLDFQFNLRFDEGEPYSVVFCDFASQELYMAALLGGIYNNHRLDNDPLWIAMIEGDKSKSTDLYSLVAAACSVKRNQAKGSTLAAFYGCGFKLFKSELMKSVAGKEARAEAGRQARKAYDKLKGEKDGDYYSDGIASNFFNWTATQMRLDNPRMPIFNQKYPQVLCKSSGLDISPTGFTNYPVQGGCALGGILSIFLELISKPLANARGKYSGSVHDMVAFIVPDENIESFAGDFINAYYQTWSTVMLALGYSAEQVPDKFVYDAVIDVAKSYRKYAGATSPNFSDTGYQYHISQVTNELTRIDNPANMIS
jgi:hypothetical protein